MIKISVNNEIKEIATSTLLIDAITQWGFADMKIAVAINGQFIPRSTYNLHAILSGDQIDIVKPIGGG